MAVIELQHISKSFPGVKALSKVDLSVEAGKVHALCGENGAGKSTLMNILTGNIQPDDGTIILDGMPVVFSNPQEAFSCGIAIVYQHLSLVDNLSISENIFANHPPSSRFGFIRFTELHRNTARLLAELQIDLDPRTLVSKLSPAQKQMAEIVKALAKAPRILILDEPTASLSRSETEVLFRIIRKLKQQGCSIIYISHRLPEIFELADRISILKDGVHQGTFLRKKITPEDLIRRMVGREILPSKREPYSRQEVLLEVNGLSGNKFHDITFALHRGEIIGMAGLVGAGRTEIARVIFGADQKKSGSIIHNQNELASHHPADTIAQRIAYVPEERKTQGLFMEMSVRDNIASASLEQPAATRRGFLFSASKASARAQKMSDRLRVVTPDIRQRVIYLSGGNQQKVVLAKWLSTDPDVLIVDEVTHGVDVGAKQEIYQILRDLAAQGKGIIMISSELQELLTLCDRILVIRQGRISGELSGDEATEEKIVTLAM